MTEQGCNEIRVTQMNGSNKDSSSLLEKVGGGRKNYFLCFVSVFHLFLAGERGEAWKEMKGEKKSGMPSGQNN